MFSLILLLTLVVNAGMTVSESCPGGDALSENSLRLSSGNAKIQHYNVVLMGATGNLATKYLWKSFYDIFKRHYSKDTVHFQIYATSRADPETARRKISRMLLGLVNCDDEVVVEFDSDCMEHKKKFIEAVQFHQLKTEGDFKQLGEKLYENSQSFYGIEPGSPNTYESGRLVYMSIPPSTYAITAKYVDMYLRPKIGRPWFRVVLEKPFGHDLKSAKSLSADLKQYLRETEIYRIDHYIAKTVVKEILPFRYKNRALYESLWNREYIEQVEIVMKESEDVSGRLEFYDKVGVIRDVMQNHMTEMLALIASDLPADSGNISSVINAKVRLLNSVRLAGRGSVLLGQYSSYGVEYLSNEMRFNTESGSPERGNMSTTPTFAAVALNIDNERWRDVPFVLISGKKMDEKSSYIRVRFRGNRLCMRAWCKSSDDDEPWCGQRQQMVFRVGVGKSHRSSIAVSKGLPSPRELPIGWKLDSDKNRGNLFGQNSSEFANYVAAAESDPYIELIEAAMMGSRHLFVSTESLLASWNLWTDVLEESDDLKPRLYLGGGKDPDRLDVMVASPGTSPALRFWVSEHNVPHHDATRSESTPTEFRQIPDTFRNATLVSGSNWQVVDKLVKEITRLATDKVARDHGAMFHLALSGGKTLEPLLRQLASSPLPWQNVHVWMVDERCDGSNFDNLERHLLSRVLGLPRRNVHPMLADLFDESCDPNARFRADEVYETSINRLISGNSFDLVILGVGSDGHTASLFPGHRESEKLVSLIEIDGERKRNRITLTLATLNNAKHVAVLVLGSEKHAILREISERTVTEAMQYPILGVSSSSMSWFVDNEALLGR